MLLTKEEARAVTDEIVAKATDLLDAVDRAFQGGAHVALGYSNWAAYCKAEFGHGRSQAYALAEIAALRRQIESDCRESEKSDWIRTLRPAHLAVLKDMDLVARDRVLSAAFDAHRRGERVTAALLRRLREEEEAQRRAASEFYVARDAANRLIGAALAFVDARPNDEALKRLVVLERGLDETGAPETDAEWKERIGRTLTAVEALADAVPMLYAAVARYAVALGEKERPAP